MALAGDELARSYVTCRRLSAAHGRTYYLATLLLPPHKRPAVHALYAFARYADDLVDNPGLTTRQRADALDRWAGRFSADLAVGGSRDPVACAVVDTAQRWQIPPALFEDFLASMRMDLSVDRYPTYADLERYMWGSAAVIGLQMLPVLELVVPVEEATPYAVALGQAFQLTNFLRDVGEDLDRGRVYLPEEDLLAHGLDRARLDRRVVDGAFRRLMAFEIDRARALYRRAEPGIAMLHPTSRDCVRTAYTLYGAILDEVERADYQVLRGRVRVSRLRRVRVAGPGLVRARLARLRRPGDPATPRWRA